MSPPARRRWSFGTLRGDVSRPRGATVAKLGGSLLEREDWPELVLDLVGGAGPAAPLTLVVGGGAVVEGLRSIDRVRRGDDSLLHRLAIDGMGITSRLVARTVGLPLATLPLRGQDDTPPGGAGPRAWAAVLDVGAWIAGTPGGDAGLPSTWEVTSDSLAARVAGLHRLDLLVAKRVPPPRDSIDDLATVGWVDPVFPRATLDVARVDWAATGA